MNDKTIELIQEQLPKLAEALKTTSEIAYDKVVWYLRVSGIIDLIQWGLFFLLTPIYIKIAKDIAKKWEIDSYNAAEYIIGCLVVYLLFLILFAVFAVGITDSIVKIVSPEYYIIQQVVTKLTQ